MPLGHAQLRAKLMWEAACERLRNTIEPPKGAPESTAAQRAHAHRLAQEALEAVRQAFEIEATDEPTLATRSDTPPRQPDGKASEAGPP
jgi:hypothetical protein